jgi:hypothetical protein
MMDELDQNVVDALDIYFELGIDGGSFVNALLAQDYKTALLTGHELLSRRSIVAHMEYAKQLMDKKKKFTSAEMEKRIELLEKNLEINALVVVGSRVIHVDGTDFYEARFKKELFDSMIEEVFGKEYFECSAYAERSPVRWMTSILDKSIEEVDTEIPSHYCLCCGMPPHNCLSSHDS